MSETTTGHEILSEYNVVGIGDTVVIHYDEDPDDVTETIQIIGHHGEGNDSSGKRTVSPLTPLGEIICGKRVGDTLTFLTPGGEELSVQIIDIFSG